MKHFLQPAAIFTSATFKRYQAIIAPCPRKEGFRKERGGEWMRLVNESLFQAFVPLRWLDHNEGHTPQFRELLF